MSMYVKDLGRKWECSFGCSGDSERGDLLAMVTSPVCSSQRGPWLEERVDCSSNCLVPAGNCGVGAVGLEVFEVHCLAYQRLWIGCVLSSLFEICLNKRYAERLFKVHWLATTICLACYVVYFPWEGLGWRTLGRG